MTNKLISIIVPVYNVEKYLKRCLDSLISQSYKYLEILCVDDGSTDLSGKILDEYALIDSRIRVFHKENGGVSRARNLALDNMTGDYVGFVDSDDFCRRDMFEQFMSCVTKWHSDFVMCGVNNYIDKDNNVDVFYSEKTEVLDLNTFKKDMFDGRYPAYSWNKFFKRELWDNVRYPVNIVMQEDAIVLLDIIYRTKNPACIMDVLYFYQKEREGSAIYINSDNHFISRFIASDAVFKFAEEHYPDWILGALIRFIMSSYELMDRYCKNRSKDFLPHIIRIKEVLSKHDIYIKESWCFIGFSDNYKKHILLYLNLALKYPKIYPLATWVLNMLNEMRIALRKLLKK